MNATKAARLGGLVTGCLAGLQYGGFVADGASLPTEWGGAVRTVCVLGGAAYGFLAFPYVTVYPYRFLTGGISELPLPKLLAAAGGLGVALFLAALMGYFLKELPFGLGVILSLAFAVLSAYWGAAFGVGRYEEIIALITGDPPERKNYYLMDTSAAIDGRTFPLAQTGLIRGEIIVPEFVKVELSHIVSSKDPSKQARGEQGQETLLSLASVTGIELKSASKDYPDTAEVDEKLIRLAKEMKASILTVDYNLNKVATFEGVSVLNVNELANALKAVVLKGESLEVTPVRGGREPHQGVGFLGDGTMVVIEGGKTRLGEKLVVAVTGVAETPAGRVVFTAFDGKANTRN